MLVNFNGKYLVQLPKAAVLPEYMSRTFAHSFTSIFECTSTEFIELYRDYREQEVPCL